MNLAENIQDRPGQPAYEMFGIKRRFQRCKVWPPRFKSPPYERIKYGYPLKNGWFLLRSTNLAREWLQTDTDLLRIITSTADELSGGTNIDDLGRPWTLKLWVLSDFFAILGCDAHLRVNFRWNILEIDQDNLRTKLSWCCRASHEHYLRFLVSTSGVSSAASFIHMYQYVIVH